MARYRGKRKRRPKRKLKSIRIDELSGVDNPAQEHARAVLIKREDDEDEFEKRVWLTTDTDGYSHLILMNAVGAGDTTFVKSSGEGFHSHPWVMDEDGEITIGSADGHTHAINEAESLEMRFTGEEPMADKVDKKTDLEAVQAEMKKMREELEIAKAINALSNDERVYYASLSDDEATKFLKSSAEDRAAIHKAATADDPVVYRSRTTGQEYRKSCDPIVLDLVKRADESELKAAKLEKHNELMKLQKRAGEYEHLAADVEVIAYVLKAIDEIDVEEIRTKAHQMLKAHNQSLGEVFKMKGVSKVNNTGEVNAHEELNKKAEELMKSKDINYYDAYDLACKAHPELKVQAYREGN